MKFVINSNAAVVTVSIAELNRVYTRDIATVSRKENIALENTVYTLAKKGK